MAQLDDFASGTRFVGFDDKPFAEENDDDGVGVRRAPEGARDTWRTAEIGKSPRVTQVSLDCTVRWGLFPLVTRLMTFVQA